MLPGMHGRHTAEVFLRWENPAGHAMHVFWPAFGWNVPAGQMMHSCVTVFFLVPAGQSPQLDDRPRFPFPFGHAVQKVAEVIFVNVFIPQDSHDVIPG